MNRAEYESLKELDTSEAYAAIKKALKEPASIDGTQDVIFAAYVILKAQQHPEADHSTFDSLASVLPQDEEVEWFPLNTHLTHNMVDETSLDIPWTRLMKLVGMYSDNILKAIVLFCRTPEDFGYTPGSLVSLAEEVGNLKSNDTVEVAMTGLGSVPCELSIDNPSCRIYAWDIVSEMSLILAAARRDIMEASFNISCESEGYSSGIDSEGKEIKAKLIFNKAFYGTWNKEHADNISSRIISRYLDKNLFDGWSLDWKYNLALLLSQPDAKVVTIMRRSSLSNEKTAKERKYFAENGYIETVIDLPGRMIENEWLNIAMVVLSRSNKEIRFIDASKIGYEYHRNGKRLQAFSKEDIRKIKKAICSEQKFAISLSNEKLQKNSYILEPQRYLQTDIESEKGVPLGELITNIVRAAQITPTEMDKLKTAEETSVCCVVSSDIQNGIIRKELQPLTDIPEKYQNAAVRRGDILMSKNGNPFKIAVCNDEFGIYVIGNLYKITVNDEKVDPYYIKAFFESSKGMALLKRHSTGDVVPMISIKELKKIKIPMFSKDEQKQIADRCREMMDEIEQADSRIRNDLAELKDMF